jgi:hypothetical protein
VEKRASGGSCLSHRIDQILDVLREVAADRCSSSDTGTFTGKRIAAVKRAADRRRISREAVQDKFGRQLQPDIMNAAAFDQLCIRWLREGSSELHRILLKHALDPTDENLIDQFFARFLMVAEEPTPQVRAKRLKIRRLP